MFLYQCFAYQIFFFCIMKVVESTIQKKMQINLVFLKGTQIFLTAFVVLHIVFILLIERNIFNFVFILSPIKFLVYALFVVVGLLVGISDKI